MTSFVDINSSRNSFALMLDFLLVLAGSFLIAFLSQIAIPLPFTPVPITLQTFAVLMVGALLGSKRGALAVITYLLEALVGFPVLAGGAAGAALVFGPTVGYLLGFIMAAWLTGYILREKPTFMRAFQVALLSSALVLITGTLILSFFVGGLKNGISFGLIPFIAGDLFKSLLFATFAPLGWNVLRTHCHLRG